MRICHCQETMSLKKIHDLLVNISDEDAEALGFDPKLTRPSWMLITCLPVPPLAVRPSVQMGSGGRSHDDLTNQYGEIVKANAGVRENIASGAPEHVTNENIQFLQFKVATLFDNHLPNMPMSMQVRLCVRACLCVCVCVCVSVCL